jgi:hypothetical protein
LRWRRVSTDRGREGRREGRREAGSEEGHLHVFVENFVY